MWIPWLLKSRSQAQTPRSPFNFRSTSLRDVQSLADSDSSSSSDPNHSPVHRSSLLRRLRTWSSSFRRRAPPESTNRVVVYFTSLRVVRRTFEDCRTVRSILKSFRGVVLDERDLSMDDSFAAELQDLDSDLRGPPPQLPRVFIDGKYIGGADEIRALHESGDLKKMIQRLTFKEPPQGGVVCCGACGGHRFRLCGFCCGSHKVFHDDSASFRACGACNPNGLIKCVACTSVLF